MTKRLIGDGFVGFWCATSSVSISINDQVCCCITNTNLYIKRGRNKLNVQQTVSSESYEIDLTVGVLKNLLIS
jgi:hypothetical protein